MASLFKVNSAPYENCRRTFITLVVVLLCAAAASGPTPERRKPATIKVSGFGLLGNRELKRTLVTLELSGRKPEFLGPAFVEDAALILAARVKRDGYLHPQIFARLQLAEGGQMQVKADDLLENPLPRPLRIRGVHFTIHKGLLYYFESLEFEGLQSVDQKQARSYFIETEALFRVKRARLYTPDRLRQGVSSLTEILQRQGYAEAKAEVNQLRVDDRTGAVNARIVVREGSKFLVHSVHEEFFFQDAIAPASTRLVFPNRAYSQLWLQDFTLSMKTNQYAHGYPDAAVQVRTEGGTTNGSRIELDLVATLRSGPQVRIAQVEFKGQKKTNQSMMARRVRIKKGELLDRIKAEQGRYRLAQLRAFETVDLNYEPVDEHSRGVLYQVKEGKRTTLSLLFGYGSYELLRGGFEVEQNNIWGLAHQVRVKAVQSFKASSGELTYTIPEFVGDADLFFNGSALRREEVSFLREEYGGGFGAHKYFKPLATDLSVRYNYQILNALDTTFPQVATEGLTNPAVGAIITDVKYDRRDNPLYPRRGFKLFSNIESATEHLGGDANYQRLDMSASWYHPIGGGRYLSLALSHGVAVSFGNPANNLPFVRRFFPGGENSIRGYQEGEASPRDAQGRIVGAETYALGTVQLEQALTPKWSLIVFSDSLGFAHRLANYPFDTGLYSVGAGIWWRTLIGPVRLEYGYNLNPRKEDPSGTIQFSIGFPF